MKKRRLAAMLTVLSMLFTACSPGGTEGETAEEGEKTEKVILTGVYAKTAVPVDENLTYIRYMSTRDGKVYMYGTMRDGEESFGTVVTLDPADDSLTYETMPEMDYASGFAVGEKGYLFMISEFDEETFTETYTLNYVENDIVAWQKPLAELIPVSESFWQTPSAVYDDGMWYIGAEMTLAIVGADGTLSKTEGMPGEIQGIFVSDGIVHVWGREFHYTVDENGALTEQTGWRDAMKQVSNNEVYTGSGYDFYYVSENALVGCNVAEDGTAEEPMELMNWVNSAMVSSGVRSLAVTSPETIYLYGNDGLGSNTGLWKYTAAPDRELDRKVIRFSYLENGSNKIPLAAVKFNNAQTEYQVICEEYRASGGYSTVLDGLEILTGDAGDILMFDSMDDMAKYADKGLLADLYTLMNDEFSADDIFGCVRDVSEIGGKLYGLPREFEVSVFSAKTENLPDYDVWDVETYLETAQNLPDGMKFSEDDSQEFMSVLLTYMLSEWVDMETNTCSFDDGSFAAYLDYLASLPETDDTAYRGEENLFASDKILLYGYAVNNYATYAMMKCAFGGWDGVSLIGFPSSEGSACVIDYLQYFSILESSDVKEGAMAFLKYLFSAECVIDKNRGMRAIPTLKSTMKAWEESEGEYYYYIYTDNLGRYSGDFQPMTEETEGRPGVCVKVTDYLDEFYTFLDSIHAYSYVPTAVKEIVMEEVSIFLGTGKTAEACADVIQSRVSLYLSEND